MGLCQTMLSTLVLSNAKKQLTANANYQCNTKQSIPPLQQCFLSPMKFQIIPVETTQT